MNISDIMAIASKLKMPSKKEFAKLMKTFDDVIKKFNKKQQKVIKDIKKKY